jgi:hypothetical protein
MHKFVHGTQIVQFVHAKWHHGRVLTSNTISNDNKIDLTKLNDFLFNFLVKSINLKGMLN